MLRNVWAAAPAHMIARKWVDHPDTSPPTVIRWEDIRSDLKAACHKGSGRGSNIME